MKMASQRSTEKMMRGVAMAAGLLLTGAMALASTLGPDGERGVHHPGRFVWFDLATDDPASARSFYGKVFGWRFRAVEGASDGYTVIEHAGGKVGGMFFHPRGPGGKNETQWLSLMSVRDSAQAARYVKSKGGEVIVAPKGVPGRGTHAVFRDPEGAIFGVLAAEGGDAPDGPVADGDVFWLDLFARDPAKAAEFYAGLGGYEVNVNEDLPGGRRLTLASGGFARAGVAGLPEGVSRPGWLPYVLVDDVRGAVDRARKAGGRILVEPQAGLLDGNLAVISDPGGGVLGIVNWVSNESQSGGKP